ncbi:MAG: GNAT family N-acetyltransferase [Pseudomonadota bacterium]|nr:GNAT family N-acetyltransferase [Pseudomonadota bacterium]
MTALRTARLSGRPIRASDARHAADLFGRDEVGRFVAESRRAWTTELAFDRALSFAAHWPAHGFGLRVWEIAPAPADDGAGAGGALPPAFAGVAGLQFCVLEGRGAIEVSFAFLPEFWGKGLAREALEAVLGEAAGVCREIEAVAHADNLRAAALLARVGFAAMDAPEVGAEAGAGSAAAAETRRYRLRLAP